MRRHSRGVAKRARGPRRVPRRCQADKYVPSRSFVVRGDRRRRRHSPISDAAGWFAVRITWFEGRVDGFDVAVFGLSEEGRQSHRRHRVGSAGGRRAAAASRRRRFVRHAGRAPARVPLGRADGGGARVCGVDDRGDADELCSVAGSSGGRPGYFVVAVAAFAACGSKTRRGAAGLGRGLNAATVRPSRSSNA